MCPIYYGISVRVQKSLLLYFPSRNLIVLLIDISLDFFFNTTAVRALVVINPGNPSGQVQSYATIEAVIRFAHRRRLVLLADEVYQHNVYAEGSKFYSFKQVLKDMGEPYSSEVELVSFMSTSKGYMSECGLRGGWAELVNLDPSVQAALYTALTTDLSPNTMGQVALDLVAKPPQLGEASYKLWDEEKTEILESLRQRAAFVTKAFNSIEGYRCNAVQGAMYAFPRFSLSKKAVEAAAAAGMAPEVFYTYQLLEETGICVLPGTSGPGRYHFRTTILPQPQVLNEMMESIKLFHQNFTKQYRD